jgi:PAS domain-containing protein
MNETSHEPAPDMPVAFLNEGGVVGEMMRQHDWSISPLGEPRGWPPALRGVVSLVLNSGFPMFVAWGPELVFLYNDSYAEILGNKHPSALGMRFEDVWSEIWADVQPIAKQAMDGKSTLYENLPLLMQRRGFQEQTWFTFSYSPIRDDEGKVSGLYCACTETTEQVLGEAHRNEESSRLRELFRQAPGIIAVVKEPNHIFEIANDAYYRLVGKRDLIGKTVEDALPEVVGQGFIELLDEVYRSGKPFIGRAVPLKLRRQQDSAMEERFLDFVYQPIRDYRGSVSGVFVEGSDVTESVRATQALRESELRLRQLANNIPQLAWMANADGEVHWYNDRWYEYTGSNPEQMLSRGMGQVRAPR